MEIKRKLIAILIILLLLAIPLSIAQASESSEKVKQTETIPVELVAYQEDGTLSTEKLFLTEQEIVELENVITKIMDEIESSGNWGIIDKIIEKFANDDSTLVGKIIGMISGLKVIKKRSFVVSSGRGIDYNPLKKITFKIRKNVALWHYNSNSILTGRTIILQPLKLNMKILKGAQVGIMTRFTGLYLSISRGFLKESYTMFMGVTRHANGIQLTPPQ